MADPSLSLTSGLVLVVGPESWVVAEFLRTRLSGKRSGNAPIITCQPSIEGFATS